MHDMKRDEQMRRWIAEGPEDSTPEHQDVVMWGVWFNVNDDEYRPPIAMFATQGMADEYAERSGEKEWAVSPCHVGSIKTRDDYRIPEPE